MMAPKKAIVTLAIGEKYERMFESYCRRNWGQYCAKHGYDLIVINQPFDLSPRGTQRSPAWQKLLILSQEWSSSYDQIVWVDTDVIINSTNSPCISSLVPLDKVGSVESYSIPSKEIHKISSQRSCENWRKNGVTFIDNKTAGLYYENRGIPGGSLEKVAQTGVFVCSPKCHREIFEYIYNEYEDHSKSAEWNYEMPAMSYELVQNNVVHWIPAEYNFCVHEIISAYYPFIFHKEKPPIPLRAASKLLRSMGLSGEKMHLSGIQCLCLNNIFEIGYFIHFAGCQEWLPSLENSLKNHDFEGMQ